MSEAADERSVRICEAMRKTEAHNPCLRRCQFPKGSMPKIDDGTTHNYAVLSCYVETVEQFRLCHRKTWRRPPATNIRRMQALRRDLQVP